MDRAYLLNRVAVTKTIIEAYEDAVLALGANGGVQTYTLDTGQSRQTVTRADLPSLSRMLDSLYNRLSTMEARLSGGATIVRPAF